MLVKLLDAKLPLSVQVHPEDDYALAHEGNELGKTEMWVVLAAEPGAEIVLGVQAGTTKEAFRAALEAGALDPLLHHVPIKAGDHICIPAGSLHALMGGALIAETLQNSDTTYRVYDWNRLGADGQPAAAAHRQGAGRDQLRRRWSQRSARRSCWAKKRACGAPCSARTAISAPSA